MEYNKIVVTGGSGFLGKRVVNSLKKKFPNVISLSSKDYNLVYEDEVRQMYQQLKPDCVVHLAAKVGGIGANMMSPGKFFYDNIMMGINLIHFGTGKIKRFVQISTVCGYPKNCPVPFKEENFWNGEPEDTNSGYGIAKKTLLKMLQTYKQEFGLNSLYLIPTNLYGPGDNYHLENSHVIPAIIQKIDLAQKWNQDKVTLWGSGQVSREFLYVDDCAEGISQAIETIPIGCPVEPINLGTGNEIKIFDLANKIKELMNYGGEIIWDNDKPDGQPRRCLSYEKAKSMFGFNPKISLNEGLKLTIEDYYANQNILSVSR